MFFFLKKGDLRRAFGDAFKLFPVDLLFYFKLYIIIIVKQYYQQLCVLYFSLSIMTVFLHANRTWRSFALTQDATKGLDRTLCFPVLRSSPSGRRKGRGVLTPASHGGGSPLLSAHSPEPHISVPVPPQARTPSAAYTIPCSPPIRVTVHRTPTLLDCAPDFGSWGLRRSRGPLHAGAARVLPPRRRAFVLASCSREPAARNRGLEVERRRLLMSGLVSSFAIMLPISGSVHGMSLYFSWFIHSVRVLWTEELAFLLSANFHTLNLSDVSVLRHVIAKFRVSP
jgi:hypothetical protein